MLLSAASDARIAKVIVMAVILVVGYLIVPLIRRIRDDAEMRRIEGEKLEGVERMMYEKKRRGIRFIWTSVILFFVDVFLVSLYGHSRLDNILPGLAVCIALAIIVFFVLGVVFLIIGRKKT